MTQPSLINNNYYNIRGIRQITPKLDESTRKELTIWGKYNGHAQLGDEGIKMPRSYYKALEAIAEKQGITFAQYLLKILIERAEADSDPAMKEKFMVGQLTEEERKYFDDFAADKHCDEETHFNWITSWETWDGQSFDIEEEEEDEQN